MTTVTNKMTTSGKKVTPSSKKTRPGTMPTKNAGGFRTATSKLNAIRMK